MEGELLKEEGGQLEEEEGMKGEEVWDPCG